MVLGLVAICAIALWFTYSRYTQSGANGTDWTDLDTRTFGRVIAIPDEGAGDVSVYLIFPKGEAHNPYNEGLAHYVEHLAWLNAFDDDASDHSHRHSNAWTNKVSTGYWASGESGNLSPIISNLITVSVPLSVDAKFAEEERDIVLREYDYRLAERPTLDVYQDIRKIIYQNGSFARSVTGTKDEIAEFDLQTARDLHRESHVLSEATLLVFGDFRMRHLEVVLDDLNVEAPSVTEPPSSHTLIPELIPVRDEADVVVADLSDEVLIYEKLIAIPECMSAVRCENLAYLAERAIDSALPGGIASPLRFDQFIARNFRFYISRIRQDHIWIAFSANPDIGVSLEELQYVFETELQKTLTNGIPEETFTRIHAREAGRLDSVLDPAEYNLDLILLALRTNTPEYGLSDERADLPTLTIDDLNQFLNDLSKPGREVIRRVRPESD